MECSSKKKLISKLQRALGLLSKIRHYVPKWLLRTIYFSLFNSHLIYGCEIWGQRNTILFQKIQKLQNKAIRIINFKPDDSDINVLYNQNKILKISDFISLKNALFVKNCLENRNNNNHPFFSDYFTLANKKHSYNTRSSQNNLVDIPPVNTAHHGHFSIRSRSATTWNTIQNTLGVDLFKLSNEQVKKLITKYYLDSYIIRILILLSYILI